MREILLVEDEPFFIRMCRKTLAGPGRSVRIAEDGNRAIAEIEKSPPHLIILDLLLPEMDGFSVLQFLKSRSDRIPVIVLSNLGASGSPDPLADFEIAAFCVKSDTSLAELAKIVDRSLHNIKTV